MPKSATPEVTIWVALLGAVGLDTLAELFWKLGVNNANAASTGLPETLFHTLLQPFFILAMLLFIPKYFNWMYILRKADLTYAKPITSLGFISVLIVSVLVLHEPVTWHKLLGVALVLAGVWMVGNTESHTSPGGNP
jgi:drug/metabolite transporter (DMT)-like permease